MCSADGRSGDGYVSNHRRPRRTRYRRRQRVHTITRAMFTAVARIDDREVALTPADACNEHVPRRSVRDGVRRRDGTLDLRERR